jgi:hypothetical protein
MPFLRRRGMLASETDMRRHSGIDAGQVSATGSMTSKQPGKRTSLADDLFNSKPESALAESRAASRLSEDVEGETSQMKERVGGTLLLGPSTATIAADRPSEDREDRPESPPVQEETPKHRRFSMLRFRNASDSQLSARLKHQQQQQQQQVAEKLPPMPKRMYLANPSPTQISAHLGRL